jgi:type VI secretion system protein ImpF
MPELTLLERLQPCLLDRLTDDDPTNPQESRLQRVVSLQRYRKGVLRDLEWLFSTISQPAEQGEDKVQLRNYPHAFRSVINFGTRQLVGMISPNMDELEKEVLEALQVFEPRILPQTLTLGASKDGNWVRFDLRGELWADPVPDSLFFRTQLDLESGNCITGDRANG